MCQKDIKGVDGLHCKWEGCCDIFAFLYSVSNLVNAGLLPCFFSWGRELLTFHRQVLLIAHYPMTFLMWHFAPGNAAKSFSWQEGHSISDLFTTMCYFNNDGWIPGSISTLQCYWLRYRFSQRRTDLGTWNLCTTLVIQFQRSACLLYRF